MRLFNMPIIILIQAAVCGIVRADLPKFIKKCKPGDGECITTQINKIIKMFPEGNAEIGLIPLKAIPYGEFVLAKPRNVSAIDLILKVKEQTTYGIENTTITKVRGFEKDPLSSNFEIHGRVPRLIVTGRYELEGKFFWSFYGGGPFKLEYLDCHFDVKIKVLKLFRNNKTYIEVYDVIPKLDMDRLIVNLENIYPLNSDLTYAINQLLTENWREVYNDLDEQAIKVVADEFKDTLNKVFRVISYDDFFL